MILSATNRQRTTRLRGGFTLIEILVVIIIIAILVGLLVPAIYGALRTARKAAVSSEINTLAGALASFKTKYGDYPPSRIWVAENGDYGSAPATQLAPGDITAAQLAQRTAAYLRKFWPRLVLNTAGQGALFTASSATWYDFNGDGYLGIGPGNNTNIGGPSGYILEGHQCLVFFLGGIPVNSNGSFGVSGFSKDPTNPFTSLTSTYGTNRSAPMYEFASSRLFADPNDTYASGVPGYYDTLGSGPPAAGGSSGLNFFAYFSAYGNGNYDPNDVNVPENDVNNNGPIGLSTQVNFPTSATSTTASGATIYLSESAAPNPYTSTLTVATGSGGNGVTVVTFLNPQSFQIISAGIDGLYGDGGQYLSSSATAATTTSPLPIDHTTAPSPYLIYSGTAWAAESPADPSIRQREGDNLTNFKASSLQ